MHICVWFTAAASTDGEFPPTNLPIPTSSQSRTNYFMCARVRLLLLHDNNNVGWWMEAARTAGDRSRDEPFTYIHI